MEEENVVTAEEIANEARAGFDEVGNTHYSQSMDAAAMQVWAKKIVEEFDKAGDIFYVLCYRGMSGISAATHLSIQLGINALRHAMLYVRKPEEQSHGKLIESFGIRDYDPKRQRLVFVFCDDFICSGNTMTATMNTIQERFHVRVDASTALLALNGSEGALRGMFDSGNADDIDDFYDRKVVPAIREKLLNRKRAEKEMREWTMRLQATPEVWMDKPDDVASFEQVTLASDGVFLTTISMQSWLPPSPEAEELKLQLLKTKSTTTKKRTKSGLDKLREALGYGVS